MKYLPLAICCLALHAIPAPANEAALKEAEQARGIMTGDTGVQWKVSVSGTNNARFVSTSQNGKIYAEVLEPEEAKGRKYLAEAKGNMWFWKPGLSRPVSVSKRQRLSGDAAIGDIASTSFVEGYKVVSAEPGDLNGEAATVYTMKSNSLTDTYAQIKYWVIKVRTWVKRRSFTLSQALYYAPPPWSTTTPPTADLFCPRWLSAILPGPSH